MKHFLALESDPELFSDLAHSIGLDHRLHYVDIFDFNFETWPTPTLSIIMIFPTTAAYEDWKASEATEPQEDSNIVWLRQTINNACGLYAVLHSTINGRAAGFLEPGSLLARVRTTSDRVQFIEGSHDLEVAYERVAHKGSTQVPDDPSAEVDYHYVCFVPSVDGSLFELDGDRAGPIARVQLDGSEDLACLKVGEALRDFISRAGTRAEAFSIMALTRT